MSGPVARVALVTGASSGIGRAVALALAAQGTTVALSGRDAERLREVADEAGPGATPLAADLEGSQAPRLLAERFADQFDRLDVLVHAAGLFGMDQVCDTEGQLDDATDLFDRLMAVNVRLPYVLTRCLTPTLTATQGQIVFVNSSAVRFPNAATAYAASKHALQGLADGLRVQLNPRGVRIISVFPGRTATPMQARIHEIEGRSYDEGRLLQPQDVASTVLNALELPRTAEVTDIHVRPMAKT